MKKPKRPKAAPPPAPKPDTRDRAYSPDGDPRARQR